MARYRKISVKMWGDDKFLALSRPKPNGQTLWQYLLTGPHTTALPCAFTSGEASLAEALDWPLAAFRKAFQEVFAKGMATADWKARLVFIPKALHHNAPENPNVVIGWRTAFDELTDCPLKGVIYVAIQAYLTSLVSQKGFSEAFRKPFSEDLPKELPKTDTVAVTETEEEGEGADAPPPAPIAIAHGEFQRALLTAEQYGKLQQRLNGNLRTYIDEFDRWVNEAPDAKDKSGIRRRDRHAYESILSWFDRAVKEGKVKAERKANWY